MNIDDLLTRGVENIIPDREKLKKLLGSGKKLNIYCGIDPTATKIHLGHAVFIRKLQTFAQMGHNVKFLIGDFTALIGDTSDKDTERPVLTYEQIKENFKTYKKQAEKILDFSRINVVHNSEWLSKLTFADVVKLCQHFSVGDFVGRELIKKRLTSGRRVALHEVLYPVMQGYDSMILDTDIQIGGTDQTFNMQAGRTLLWDMKQKESFVFATGFLEGTDGRKMSKSWGNAIWLDDEPIDMFGKVMSLKDDLVINYFTLGTNLGLDEIKEKEKRLSNGENPMVIKKELALQIVTELHSKSAASNAQKYFESTFQERKIMSEDLPQVAIPFEILSVVDLLVEARLVESKSEAKRLVEQLAVEVQGKVIDNIKTAIDLTKGGVTVKVGKKKFAQVTQAK